MPRSFRWPVSCGPALSAYPRTDARIRFPSICRALEADKTPGPQSAGPSPETARRSSHGVDSGWPAGAEGLTGKGLNGLSVEDPRRSIRTKLLLTMGGLAVGACLLLGFSTIVQLRRVTLRQTHDSLVSISSLTAHNIAAGLDFGMPNSVQNALSGLFGIDGVRFAQVHDATGRVFVAMGDSPPVAIDLAPPASTTVDRHPEMLVARSPVRDATGLVIGTLAIGFSLAQTNHLIQTNVLLLLGITLALAAISVFIGHTLGRRLTTPLLGLTEAARRLGLGLFDEPLQINSNDEVGLLARTFNMMTARLASFRREVERTNQQLEAKVRERTEELRQKNITLELQNERALEASRLKSAFLANVSHELRTPLNGILALSELLQDGLAGELTDEQRSHVLMIYGSGSNLLKLINDILDISKIEAGRMELRPAMWDILGEIRSITTEMQPLAAGRGLDLRVGISDGAPVWIDRDRLRQIVVNLLGNAIKFTERGYVEITASIDARTERLSVEVVDTGIGIAPEDQRAIFQEFRQVDGSPSRRYGGTGLGLSISLRLAELMGGRLSVESALGQGSRFRLSIPVPRSEPAQDQPQEMPEAA